jgi:hypothetical protein
MLIEIAVILSIISWVVGVLSVPNATFPIGSSATPFKWTPWTIGLAALYYLADALGAAPTPGRSDNTSTLRRPSWTPLHAPVRTPRAASAGRWRGEFRSPNAARS